MTFPGRTLLATLAIAGAGICASAPAEAGGLREYYRHYGYFRVSHTPYVYHSAPIVTYRPTVIYRPEVVYRPYVVHSYSYPLYVAPAPVYHAPAPVYIRSHRRRWHW